MVHGTFDIVCSSFDIVCSSADISLSTFFYFIESHENTMLEFLFCYLKKLKCKKKIHI